MKKKQAARRRTRIFVTMLLMSVLTASCSSAPASKPEEEGPVELTLMHSWGEFGDVIRREVIDQFEREHQSIKVKIVDKRNVDWDPTDEHVTLLSGEEAPDVVILDRFVTSAYAHRGALADLSNLIKRANISSSEYYSANWEECTYQGNSYCLPWETDTRMMFYNKTLMSAAGFDPEKPPRTIEELDLMADRITAYGDNGNIIRIGYAPLIQGERSLYTIGMNFGGQWVKDGEFTPNEPGIVKALEWMVKYREKYDSIKLSEFMDQTWFKRGTMGFIMDHNWILHDFLHEPGPTFEWGIAPMPSLEEGKQVTWSGGASLAMTKGSKHPEEAWELLKYLAHGEGAKVWAKAMNEGNGHFISPLLKVNEEIKLAELKPALAPFLEALPQAVPRPKEFALLDAWEEMHEVTNEALAKRGQPEQLLDDWKKKLDQRKEEMNLN